MRTTRRIDVAELLTDDEIQSRLSGSGWHQEGEHIVRDWQFKDFAAAIAFVNEVAAVAEDMNHHPDIIVHGWNKVRLSVTNHSAGGLTDADFALAKRVDALS
jgi:4a-hydroxytetrahydrobiopterin dehydratase